METTGSSTLAEQMIAIQATVAERQQKIRDDARCEGCGTTLKACMSQREKDPTAPPWFGCCARGVLLDVPCLHRQDPVAVNQLMDEILAGHVRTVDEVDLEGRVSDLVRLLAQDVWWRKRDGSMVRIAEMSPGHRYNSAAMLKRNLGEALPSIIGTALYRRLTAGLTVYGDGTEPHQKTGRNPVTGEVEEKPPPMTRACPLDDCGCSGEAHA